MTTAVLRQSKTTDGKREVAKLKVPGLDGRESRGSLMKNFVFNFCEVLPNTALMTSIGFECKEKQKLIFNATMNHTSVKDNLR